MSGGLRERPLRDFRVIDISTFRWYNASIDPRGKPLILSGFLDAAPVRPGHHFTRRLQGERREPGTRTRLSSLGTHRGRKWWSETGAGRDGRGKTQEIDASADAKRAPACIYCAGRNLATTIAHMPPIQMFEGRQRPGGFEFPACRPCNNGTGQADLVASMLARVMPHANTDQR